MIADHDCGDGYFSSEQLDEFTRNYYDATLSVKPNVSHLPLLDSVPPVISKDLEYYIWWRTRVRKADYIYANCHMVRFFFREMFLMNESDETIELWLSVFESQYKGTAAGDTAYVIRTRFMFARGLSPERIRTVRENSEQLEPHFLLAGPSFDLPEHFVRTFIDEDAALPEGFIEFLDIVLERFASVIWEERDIGIIEFLSNYRHESTFSITPGYGALANRTFIVDRPFFTKPACDKFADIVRYSLSKFSRSRSNGKNPKVCDEMRAVVKQTLADIGKPIQRPSEWLPGRTMCIYPNDGRELCSFYQRGDGTLTYRSHPVIHRVRATFRSRYDTNDWDEGLRIYVDDAQPSECEYTPCCMDMPNFCDLNGKMLGYFVYWRSEVLKGNYMDTDVGYLSLLLVEIIRRHSCERGETMARLLKLAEVYPCELTKETCISFALINGYELPPFENSIENDWCDICSYYALRKDPIRNVNPLFLNYSTGRPVKNEYLLVNNREMAAVLDHILNGFDMLELKTAGKRLCDNVNGKQTKLGIDVFFRLRIYGISFLFTIDVKSPMDDPRILNILRVSLNVAARRVCIENCSSSPRMLRDADPETVRQAEEFADGFVDGPQPYEESYPSIQTTSQRHPTDSCRDAPYRGFE